MNDSSPIENTAPIAAPSTEPTNNAPIDNPEAQPASTEAAEALDHKAQRTLAKQQKALREQERAIKAQLATKEKEYRAQLEAEKTQRAEIESIISGAKGREGIEKLAKRAGFQNIDDMVREYLGLDQEPEDAMTVAQRAAQELHELKAAAEKEKQEFAERQAKEHFERSQKADLQVIATFVKANASKFELVSQFGDQAASDVLRQAYANLNSLKSQGKIADTSSFNDQDWQDLYSHSAQEVEDFYQSRNGEGLKALANTSWFKKFISDLGITSNQVADALNETDANALTEAGISPRLDDSLGARSTKFLTNETTAGAKPVTNSPRAKSEPDRSGFRSREQLLRDIIRQHGFE